MKIPNIVPDKIEVFGQIKELLKFDFADNIVHRKTGLGREVRLIFEDETQVVGIPKLKKYLLPVCIEAIKGVDSGVVLVIFTDGSSCKTTIKRGRHSSRDTYLINTTEVQNYIQRTRYSASDIESYKQAAVEPLTVTEAMLFKIAMGCPDLDRKTRGKPPNHWQAFLAAWKDGMNDYDMQARHKWPRRTAGNRLRAVECAFLGGVKVSELLFDPAILQNVEKQLKAAHEKHAKKIWRPDLLNDTSEDEDKDN